MVQIKAFKALRPDPRQAENIVSVPYDVVERDEAREMAAGKPMSFLRIVRSDLEFEDSADPYGPEIYRKARKNLEDFTAQGGFVYDNEESLYIYRLNMGGHQQTGIVAISSIDDYIADRIKKHELTRAEKEVDRTTHIDATAANTGPVFLLYNDKDQPQIAQSMDAFADQSQPLYDVSFDDGVRHRLYRVPAGELQEQLLTGFGKLPATYIADGHHRAASAVSVGKRRRERAGGFSGEELFNFFLTVIFPDNQMQILPYNRAVTDLQGRSPEELRQAIAEKWELQPGKKENLALDEANMYLDGQWHSLKAKPGSFDPSDAIDSLMVSILQKNLLEPLLGIDDPRRSDRIKFVGGIKGDGELERLVQGGTFAVSFALPPVSTQQLLAVADAGKIMPPKSTWFEPKLRSGFVVHRLDGPDPADV